MSLFLVFVPAAIVTLITEHVQVELPKKAKVYRSADKSEKRCVW